MKISLLTYGSRGDVQPFAALALGLQKAGHSVRLAAPQRFASFAAELGIPFVGLAGDPEEMSLRLNDAHDNVLRAVKSMADYVFSIAGPVARVAFAACDDADLIVHSFLFTTGAHSLARLRGIPDVSVQGFPIFAPTRAFPMAAMANTPPGARSYFSHWLASQIFWRVGNLGFRRLRHAEPDLFNIDPIQPFKLYWPFEAASPVHTPLIFAYSPVVLPRPADWTAPYIHISGYFFLNTPETYQPPQELIDFLAAGEAPVCVTFGSMLNRQAGQIDGVLCLALAQAGQRAILLTGWGGREPGEGDDHLLSLQSAPHDWLLPRCKFVVHHGGAGTTAAGLRAGIPNIVLPHAGDQPFWGRRVAAIGAGPAPIPLNKLSVQTLAAAFAQAQDPALQGRAREIGRLIRGEDGVGNAVRLIEGHAVAFGRQDDRSGASARGQPAS